MKTRRDYRDARGNKLPGVTTILGATLGWNKDALIGWAHKLGREGRSLRERDEAAAKGIDTHECVEKVLVHNKDPFMLAPPSIASNAARVVDFIRSRFEVVHAVECAISAPELRCGGTIDLVADDCIVDLKTGRGVYDEVAVQLGAYQGLWEIECARRGVDIPTRRGLVIHAHPGEPLRIVEVSRETLHAGATIFMRLLDVYHLRDKCKIDGTGAM